MATQDAIAQFHANMAAVVAHDDWVEGHGPFAPEPPVDIAPQVPAPTDHARDQLDYLWNEIGAPFRSADY